MPIQAGRDYHGTWKGRRGGGGKGETGKREEGETGEKGREGERGRGEEEEVKRRGGNFYPGKQKRSVEVCFNAMFSCSETSSVPLSS